MSKLATRLFISSVLLSIGLFFSSKSVYSVRSIKIDSYKDSFHNDEEGEVLVSLSGFEIDEEIHVKGVFAGDGSTNYFGFTKIGGEWVKNSIKTDNQPKVRINNWDNKLKVKPDLTDTGFHGSADYDFKIGYYYLTTGGNLSSVNWSDSVKVHLDFVPSPTPLPTVLPTSTMVLQPTTIPTSTPKVLIKINPTYSPNPTRITSIPPKENKPTNGKILSGVTALPGIEEISKNQDTSSSADNVLGVKDKRKTNSISGQIVTGLLIVGATICFITGIYFSIKIVKRKEKTEISQ